MPPETKSVTPAVFYRTLSVQGLEFFYREAGPRDAPTVSLLPGFPSSSHMFRNLIPVAVLAVALAEFGVLETGRIAQQAQHRLRFLDEIDTLITNPDTKEAAVHTALATNLWVFGVEFALVVSNTTLANTLKKYTDEKFTGPRAQYRPDLLLLTQLGQRYKLVEFKRPSHTLDRRDVSQAEQYRDDLISRLQPIDVVVLGKEFDARMLVNMPANVALASYTHLISRARAELQWLLGELTRDAAPTDNST
jgi:hypothetical protein